MYDSIIKDGQHNCIALSEDRLLYYAAHVYFWECIIRKCADNIGQDEFKWPHLYLFPMQDGNNELLYLENIITEHYFMKMLVL